MKRKCPECGENELNQPWFKLRNNLQCQNCNQYFRYSQFIVLLNVFFNILILSIVVFDLLNNKYYDFLLVLLLTLVYFYLLSRHFPVVKLQFNTGEPVILPPTDVEFEKTDDVSENIKRYKEAQRKAVEEIRLNKKSGWFN